jgi:ubiquinol-cytochrome c reductase cytochrome c1 subunit
MSYQNHYKFFKKMKKFFNLKSLVILIVFSISEFSCYANQEQLKPKNVNWPFDGFLGNVDKKAAQRGFKVYKEVCSACHSLERLSYRNLQKIGFSKEEIVDIAGTHEVTDGPNDKGEMFTRKAGFSDNFVSPFENELAARYANNGAYPLDLSLIIKAREDGANYVYSILTGYEQVPVGFKLNDGLNYNPYFPGKQIAMPMPLSDGIVTYDDGTSATVDQMARDVVVFLQWAAEPEMEHRKSLGLKVAMFLLIFIFLFMILNKKTWSRIK